MPATEGRDFHKPHLTHRPGYLWVVLGMGFLGVLGGVGLGRFAYSAILPSMQKGLQMSSAPAGALASWNFAGYPVIASVGAYSPAGSDPAWWWDLGRW